MVFGLSFINDEFLKFYDYFLLPVYMSDKVWRYLLDLNLTLSFYWGLAECLCGIDF